MVTHPTILLDYFPHMLNGYPTSSKPMEDNANHPSCSFETNNGQCIYQSPHCPLHCQIVSPLQHDAKTTSLLPHPQVLALKNNVTPPHQHASKCVDNNSSPSPHCLHRKQDLIKTFLLATMICCHSTRCQLLKMTSASNYKDSSTCSNTTHA